MFRACTSIYSKQSTFLILQEELNLLMKNGELDDEEDAEACRQLLKTMSSHESYDGDGYPIVK